MLCWVVLCRFSNMCCLCALYIQVSNKGFALACVRNDLHTHLQHTAPTLVSTIKEYAAKVSAHLSPTTTTTTTTTAATTTTAPPSSAALLEVEPPKVLADVFEALIGAVYVDSGRSLSAAWHAFCALLPLQPQFFF